MIENRVNRSKRWFLQGLKGGRLLKLDDILGWIMRKKETFDSVKVWDIVCLDHYPYKPFKIIFKGRYLGEKCRILTLCCETPIHSERVFTAEEFNKAGYHITDEKET